MDQDETSHGGRLNLGHIVLNGDPTPPKKSTAPIFAHVCCGQTAGWIKMPPSTEINLRPGDIALDRQPAPPPQKKKWGDTAAPHFSAHVLWPNGLIDQNATWYGGGPQPWRHCVRWGLIHPKGAQPPIFGTCLLWPNGWMDQGATWYGGRYQPKRHC